VLGTRFGGQYRRNCRQASLTALTRLQPGRRPLQSRRPPEHRRVRTLRILSAQSPGPDRLFSHSRILQQYKSEVVQCIGHRDPSITQPTRYLSKVVSPGQVARMTIMWGGGRDNAADDGVTYHVGERSAKGRSQWSNMSTSGLISNLVRNAKLAV
jgi:hypothetical protein